MALLDEIATYLAAQNIGAGGWTIVKSRMPPTPDKIVAIFETGGPPREQATSVTLERPTFQVRVRGQPRSAIATAYPDARTKLQACVTALDKLVGQTLSGTLYPFIFAEGSTIALGDDGNLRPELVQNFRAAREG